MYWLRSNNDCFSNILYDTSFTMLDKTKLLAQQLNENLYLHACQVMYVWKDRVVPVCFKKANLKTCTLSMSPEHDIRVVKMNFHDETEEADFLLAENTTYDDESGGEITTCRIYFSNRCSEHMAATAYFLIMYLSLVPEAQFDILTLRKLSSRILRRYGKRLTPSCLDDFWEERLELMLKEDINFRDQLMKLANRSNSSLYRIYNKRIRQKLKQQKLVDLYFDPISNRITYFLRLGIKNSCKYRLMRVFYGPATRRYRGCMNK